MTNTKSERLLWVPGLPGALLGIALAAGVTGCGLKGDLYLTNPNSGQTEEMGSLPEDDIASGSGSDPLQIEQIPAADSQSDTPNLAVEAAALEGVAAEALGNPQEDTTKLTDSAIAIEADAEFLAPTATNELEDSEKVVEGNSAEDTEGSTDETEEQINTTAKKEWETDSSISESSISENPEATTPAP